MIGAGNLATHLSKALYDTGFDIVQVYSRSKRSATDLADALKTNYTVSIDKIVTDASLYIISVSDDAISGLVDRLPVKEQLVVHTAGSVPMDIFSGKLENYGVMYPLQTFSKERPVDFSNIPVFIEASSSGNLEKLRMVTQKVSSRVYEMPSDKRIYLHLSAVFGCNFVNSMYGVAADILQETGCSFDVLSSLILETAQKAIISNDPGKVQTGPAIRKDQHVMNKHIALLSDHPEWQDLYIQISRFIKKQAE
jgi:predicted short-subunit dehydrogenase-like oxidoreductase (DUF2520 family)